MGIKLKRLKDRRIIILLVLIACASPYLFFTLATLSKLPSIVEHIRHELISNQFGTDNLNDLQWWLSNNGSFASFNGSPLAWGVNKKQAIEGVDLNIGDDVHKITQKLPLMIAVIDTGVDIAHPAISDGIFVNSNEISDDGIDNDANGYIDDYMGWDFYDNDNSITSKSKEEMIHGTASVGLLVGSDKVNGYGSLLSQYDINVLCIRVLGGKTNSGNLTNIADAIQYANTMGVKICCMAINTDINSNYLKDVMSNSNMLFVVSAGNEGYDLNKFKDNYPTHYRLPNVISVADLRCDGNLSETSNYGNLFVDIAAPGTNILCAKSGGGYEFYSGTSLGVYHVVSEAALIYINSQEVLTALNIKNIILQNVTPLQALHNKLITSGIPNVENAINAVCQSGTRERNEYDKI